MDKNDVLKLIKSEQDVKNVLLEIKAVVAKTHKNCNISRTVGSSVSAAGTVTTIIGIFLAPVTGGLSLGLTIGGITATVAGATTNITTDVVNSSKNKKYAKRLQKVLQERLNEYIRIGKKISKHGLRDGLVLAGKGTYFVGSSAFKVYDVTKTLQFLYINREIYGITNLTAASLSTATYSGVLLESTKGVLNKGLGTLGVTGFRVGARYLFVGLGVAAIAWDAYSLTKDWTCTPELCEKIDEIVIELDKKMRELEELMNQKDAT